MEVLNNDIECDVSNDEEDSSEQRRRRHTRLDDHSWDTYFYTIAMFFNHFAYGVNYSLYGPTLVDFKYMLNTTINWISIALIFANIGYIFGSLFGLLYKYVNRQITLVLLVFGMSASIGLMPFCPNVWTFFICQFFNGLGAGAWDTGNNVWLVEMWPNKHSAVMQFSQFMYGLGSVLAPILVKPYLMGDNTNRTVILEETHELLDYMSQTSTGDPVDRRQLLMTPFLITAGLQGLIPTVLLIMFFTNRYKSPNEKKLKRKDSTESLISAVNEQNSSIETSVRSNSPTLQTVTDTTENLLIALFAIFLSIYCSLEGTHFNYSSTYYQFIPLKITAQNAAEILSVMCTTYTIGRCVSAFIALKVGPKVMIIYHLLILMVAMAVLYYGQHSKTLIWIGNIIIGFGFSAMYSSIIALTANHITLTDTVSTVLVFGNGITGAVTPFILGRLIESYPPIFVETELVYLILSSLLFLMIITLIERRATRRNQHLL